MTLSKLRRVGTYAAPLRWGAYVCGGIGLIWVVSSVACFATGDDEAALGFVVFAVVTVAIGSSAYFASRWLAAVHPQDGVGSSTRGDVTDLGVFPEGSPGKPQDWNVFGEPDIRLLTPGAFFDARQETWLEASIRWLAFVPFLMFLILCVVSYEHFNWMIATLLGAVSAVWFIRLGRRESFVWYAIDRGELLVRDWEGKLHRIDVLAIRNIRLAKWRDGRQQVLNAAVGRGPAALVVQCGKRQVRVSPNQPRAFAERLQQEIVAAGARGPSRQKGTVGEPSQFRKVVREVGMVAVIGVGAFVAARLFQPGSGAEGAIPENPPVSVGPMNPLGSCAGVGARVLHRPDWRRIARGCGGVSGVLCQGAVQAACRRSAGLRAARRRG